MNELLDIKELEGLSEQEKNEVLKILKEYSTQGKSESYNELLYEDYAEIPVDIETFVDDYNYLGNAWHDKDGNTKLYPYWRKELRKIFPDNLTTTVNNAIFSGSRGRGKAQPLDSLVLTEDGFKRMSDITFQDKVYGNDGRLHNIIGIYPQGVKPVCKVTFNDRTSTLCCDEHLWKVYNIHTKKWIVVETKELINTNRKLKDKHRGFNEHQYKIPITQPINFKKKDLFIDPYVLGVLIGDGNLTTGTIKFSSADEEIVKNIEERIKEDYKVNKYKGEKYEYSIIKRINNSKYNKEKHTPIHIANKYNEMLTNYNLNVKSEHKYIPKDYLYSSVEDRINLLQGLMDTDGYIDKTGRMIYTTISERLKNNFIWLVQSLGGVCKITEKYPKYKDKNGEIKKCQKCYNIDIKLPKNIIPFKLTRKIKRINPKTLQPSRYIESIEYVEEQECQCIVLDSEEHLYLTNDFIVTHNSEISCLCMAYMLHRVLCLKDPVSHFHLKPTEKIVFAFMNIKLSLAEEIGNSKFQNTLLSSPWFISHGEVVGRTKKLWVPKKYNGNVAIDIKIGSQADDLIGLPIYACLDGDTIINTTTGDYKIKELVGKPIRVKNIDQNGNIITSDECTVEITSESKEEYEIELEDGTIIKCTPNHKLMLKDGSYKEVQYLTEEDELFDINITYKKFIDNIINTRGQWDITNGEYFEVHHIIPKCLGGDGQIRKGRTLQKHPNLIWLTAQEHFIAHKLLALENPNNYKLVLAWSMMAFPKGKTNRQFEITPDEYKILKEKQSEFLSNPENNPFLKNKEPWNKGLTKETDERLKKISIKSKGKNTWCKGLKRSDETKEKMSIAVKKRYKENPESFKSTIKGKVAINNGKECIYINKDDELPYGYVYGQGHHKQYIIKDLEKVSQIRSDLARGENNPMYKKGYKISGGKNGHAIYIYTYKNIDYQCRDDLMVILKQEYPSISESTIRRIMTGEYTSRISKKYQRLIDHLSWRLKNEN